MFLEFYLIRSLLFLTHPLFVRGLSMKTAESLKCVPTLRAKGDLGFVAGNHGRAEVGFGDVADDLMYICENGALVVYKGKILSKTVMDRETVLGIVEDILSMPDCEVLLSGKYVSYLRPKTKAYYERIHDRIKNNVYLPVDFSKIEDDFIKVACCDLSGIDNSKEHFYRNWSDKVQTAVSGQLYFDFTAKGVNKGNALTNVLKKLNISSKEAMAFGDSYNDLEMLRSVRHSYAMSDADSDVISSASMVTDDVCTILRKVLRGEIT